MIMDLLNFYAILVLASCVICYARVASGSAPTMCLNDDGLPVDWSITYKLPVLRKSVEPFRSGWSYAYITSEQQSQGTRTRKGSRTSSAKSSQPSAGWTISEKLLTQPDSLIMRTLDQVQQNSRLSTIYYSDQPPEKNSPGAHRAHAKGALVMDEKTNSGFWLVHTVPKFPQARGQPQGFLGNSRIYAQTFLCISFKLSDSGETIIRHLVNLRPQVYDSHISKNLYAVWPELNDLSVGGLKGRRMSGIGHSQMAQVMVTQGGEQLGLYSQSGDAGMDMFDWLKSELKTNLYVESWRNGVGKLKSNCPADQFRVHNIQDLKVKLNTGHQLTWSYRQDHSKWAIAENEESGIICLSDVNRMRSQFHRGGGSVCIRCPNCWRTFSSSILDVEPCPSVQDQQIDETNSINSDYDEDDDEDTSSDMELE